MLSEAHVVGGSQALITRDELSSMSGACSGCPGTQCVFPKVPAPSTRGTWERQPTSSIQGSLALPCGMLDPARLAYLTPERLGSHWKG